MRGVSKFIRRRELANAYSGLSGNLVSEKVFGVIELSSRKLSARMSGRFGESSFATL